MTPYKHIFWLLLSGILITSVASPILAENPTTSLLPIPPYQVEYRLSRGRMTFARVDVTLSYPSANHYRFEAITTPIGFIAAFRDDVLTEVSEGIIVNQSFRPLHYKYQRTGSKKNKLVTVDFDWEKKRVLNKSKDSRWFLKIDSDVHDKYNKQLGMMLGLANQKKEVSIKVADGGKVKTYKYVNQKSENININGISYPTLTIKRFKNNTDSKVTLWVDPKRSFLPIKVKKKENDGNYTLLLHKVIIDPITDSL